ncbi:hypothetical protein [Actinokineospora sp. NPDC004072]
MAEAAVAALPDYRSILAGRLGPDDPVRAFAFSNHMAQQGTDGGGDLTWLTGIKLDHLVQFVTSRINARKHIGGPEGSDARRVSRKAAYPMLVLATRTFSVWNFGIDGQATPPECYASYGIERVRAITEQGPTRRMRTPVRVSFHDESFVDFNVITGMAPEVFGDFLALARTLGR